MKCLSETSELAFPNSVKPDPSLLCDLCASRALTVTLTLTLTSTSSHVHPRT